ncbi:MAG: hypothetical protein IH600_13150 [Bacteroidetes bacterium]|nr:hypothetical protein [Bacteroidota bacterium]
MKYNILTLAAAMLLLSACSSTEEQVKPEPPPVKKETEIKHVEPVRVFTYTERYYVKGASIGDPTDVDDPLQAIRVIQLKPGTGEVLVVSSFDKQDATSLETWFGIELPSFAPGTYDLAKAKKIAFYRFYLGDEKKRIDGQSCEGTLKVESNADGELIGSIEATVIGTTRSFDEGNKPVRVTFTGSFRIQEVELENTLMKSR